MPRPYSNSPARMARLKAQRLAMYANRPSRNEVANQLLEEGLIFRRMHRPARSKRPGLPPPPQRPKRPKRVPYPIDV